MLKHSAFIAVVLALTLAACGEEKRASQETLSASPGQKPSVAVPDGAPPKTLQITDIITGSGPEATAGKTVEVHYVGVAYSTKQEFDASWDRGSPFAFTVGAGNVIRGWDQGVPGMKVGGRRQLIIPPDLAYGPNGTGPIGPNETLIFVIDLLKVS